MFFQNYVIYHFQIKIAIGLWLVTVGFIIYTLIYSYVINPYIYKPADGKWHYGINAQILGFLNKSDISSTGFILIAITLFLLIIVISYTLILIIKRIKKND